MEAKKLSKKFNALQLKMAEMILSLTPSELEEFNNWTRSQLPERLTQLESSRNKNST
jgi:hypothetical protein